MANNVQKGIELRCSRKLALWLGAMAPETLAHHKRMRDAGDLLVRDEANDPLFWEWQPDGPQ